MFFVFRIFWHLFCFFILVSLLSPFNKPLAAGSVYLGVLPEKETKPHIILDSEDENLKENISKIVKWKKEKRLKKIVVYVSKYKITVYYLLFLAQNELKQNEFNLSVKRDNISIENIITNYFSFIRGCISYIIYIVNNIVNKINIVNKN